MLYHTIDIFVSLKAIMLNHTIDIFCFSEGDNASLARRDLDPDNGFLVDFLHNNSG